jgi:hypothetical protein
LPALITTMTVEIDTIGVRVVVKSETAFNREEINESRATYNSSATQSARVKYIRIVL